MISRLLTIALAGAGVVGSAAYSVAQAQTQVYGGSPAPNYYADQAQTPGGVNGGYANAPNENPGPTNMGSANPGTVNYVEGTILLDGTALNRSDVGRAYLQPGEVLSTRTGKAEVLLTPGVFLRLDDNSAVKMISPDLTQTQVEVERGRAAVEVDQIFPQNNLEVMVGGVATQLVKPGFYEFTAGQPTALVFEGQAEVKEGNGRDKEIKGHHEVSLVANAELKSRGFNPHDAEDQFYNWSSLRSEYLAEANNQIAGEYAGVQGFNPGWYWDPYMWDYTFIGLGPYWSPFGFGFFPAWGWYGGYWGGGWYGGRYYGGHYVGRGGYGGAVRSGAVSGGAVRSGGFAGGGFEGGGFGGGFHGGGGGGGHR
jgi:hypothetical protein